ncbi:shiftless antiviral inhibitor of ribosomal frameshifting protein homolog isoform X2 [Polyodon spathula]|uniref:shiftless antiviral inhibitor of ribosomal frameshifting protein homolog isoform X2 n=1 Tax=Polyodon spathula TaxID=7913 RepID=UPI001B7DED56|nr:shiftless antiviral inhibitor of ribosomal frameshifting protein homolog isoform X2 [Polyodon spathula]
MSRRLHDEIELEKSIRRLREKFYGKVTVEKAAVLMQRYHNNHDLVCKDIILMKDLNLDAQDRDTLRNDAVVRNVVERIRNADRQPQQNARPPGPSAPGDQDIQDIGEGLRMLTLTQRNLQMFDNAQRNLIPSEDCQFACQGCDKVWWRRVPQRKKVSRCHGCGRKYDPVPCNNTWGAAEFNCPGCHRTFRGYGIMGLLSPCYNCHLPVDPSRILPPRRTPGPRQRNIHSCFAEDCYNRRNPTVPGAQCVHPRSRRHNHKPMVVHPSPLHCSSGSTVATCLSQGSLLEGDLDDLIMDDLMEEEEEEEDEEGGETGGPSESEG